VALDLIAAVAVRSPLNHPRLGLGSAGCARRAGTASKGALFVARLRDVMGERAFWAALGKYTRCFAGRAATTRDFQAVFAAEPTRISRTSSRNGLTARGPRRKTDTNESPLGGAAPPDPIPAPGGAGLSRSAGEAGRSDPPRWEI